MLETSFPDIEVVGECASVAESVARLREKPDEADLIFMDVELSDGECFEIFRQVTVKKPVVMTTAYDSYAVKAFEAGSIDYLLKPIDASALKRAVERCRQFSTGDLDVEKILGAISRKDSGHGYKERYLVQFNDRIVPVKADEIAFFYSEDKNNHVVTHGGAVYIVDSTMDSLITDLDPERFFRISRSCIFAKDAIECVTKLLGGRLRVTPKVHLSTNLGPAPDLTVSRSRAGRITSLVSKWGCSAHQGAGQVLWCSGAQEGRFRSRRVIDAVMVGRQSAAGSGERAAGSGERAAGNEQRRTSSGERAVGNEQRGTSNGQRGTNWEAKSFAKRLGG